MCEWTAKQIHAIVSHKYSAKSLHFPWSAANPGMRGLVFQCLWWLGIYCRNQHFNYGGKDYKGFCPLLTTVQPLGSWMELKVLNRNKNVVNALKSTMRIFFFHSSGGQAERRERKKRNKNFASFLGLSVAPSLVMANRGALSALSK